MRTRLEKAVCARRTCGSGDGLGMNLRLPPPQSTDTRSTATATATTNGHTTTANGYTTTYAALHVWHTVPFRAKTTYTTHTPLPRHVLGRVLIEHAPAVVGGDTSGDHHGGREDEQREAGAGHSARGLALLSLETNCFTTSCTFLRSA